MVQTGNNMGLTLVGFDWCNKDGGWVLQISLEESLQYNNLKFHCFF